MEGLALSSGDRQARDGREVAQTRISTLLAMEIERAPGWTPSDRQKIRRLIRKMSLENPTWGTPRIQAELHLLGFSVAESTVAAVVYEHHRAIWLICPP